MKMRSCKRTFSDTCSVSYKLLSHTDQETCVLSKSFKLSKFEDTSNNAISIVKDENLRDDVIIDEITNESSLQMRENENYGDILGTKEEILEEDQKIDDHIRKRSFENKENDRNIEILELMKENEQHDQTFDDYSNKASGEKKEDHEIIKLHNLYPQKLMNLNFNLDLYTLCMVRKLVLLYKYATLKISLSPIVSRWGRVVLGHLMLTVNGRNTIVHIEHADTYYQENSINFSKLFAKNSAPFSIFQYYNGFVEYICQNPNSIDDIKNVDYVVMYSNAGLELTEDLKLKQGFFKYFYPHKLEPLDYEQDQFQLVKDFLFTNESVKGRVFYRFVINQKLLNFLTFSEATLRSMKKAKLEGMSEQIVKQAFLEKLVLAVKQPNREELNRIVKKEINQYNNTQKEYLILKQLVIENMKKDLLQNEETGQVLSMNKEKHCLVVGSQVSDSPKNIVDTTSHIAAMFCLHALCLQNDFKTLKIVGNITAGPYNILITYKNKNIYLSFDMCSEEHSSDYKKHSFEQYLGKLFKYFVESHCEIRYFVIYTNLEELNHNLRLTSVNLNKKKYKFLKDISFIAEQRVFKLAKDNVTHAKLIKLSKTLKKSLQEGEKSVKDIQDLKLEFIHKLLFAVKQPFHQELKHNLLNEIKRAEQSKAVPYNYPQLKELALKVLDTFIAVPIDRSVFDSMLKVCKEFPKKDTTKLVQSIIQEYKLFSQLNKDQCTFLVDRLCNQLKQASKVQSTNAILNNSHIEENNNQLSYISLKAYMVQCVTSAEQQTLGVRYKSKSTIYSQSLIAAAFHTLYTHKHMWGVSFTEKPFEFLTQSHLTLNYRNRLTYILSQTSNSNISFVNLFPAKKFKESFSLNKSFSLYQEAMEYKMPLRYLVIYTNASLVLRKDLRMSTNRNADHIQFEKLNRNKKKYKVLSVCSFLDIEQLYQISMVQDLSNILNGLEVEDQEVNLTCEEMLSLKKDFIKKLIFATRQPNQKILEEKILNEVMVANATKSVPYTFEELLEVALRCLENHILESITKSKINLLLNDLKMNKSSIQKFEIANIEKMLAFVKRLAGKEGSFAYEKLLSFLIREGRLRILESNKIKFSNFSAIIGNKLHSRSASAFKEIYDLWFDPEGKKTRYLTTLEENNIRLSSITSILHGTKKNAAKAYKELFNLWFSAEGKKTHFLTVIEKNRIELEKVFTMLSTSTTHAAKAFEDLFSLWFDAAGNKTRYLKTLDDNQVSYKSMLSVLGTSGYHSAKSFLKLFDLWFDADGKKSFYLRTLEKEGIKLSNINCILSHIGRNTARLFKRFFHLLFDKSGKRTYYLKKLQSEGIKLSNISTFLKNSHKNAPETFKEAFNLWFDKEGNRTHYLEVLKKEGIEQTVVTRIVHGSGKNAPKIYKEIVDLWFNKKGEKRRCIRRLEKHGITILHISHILSHSSKKASKAFKELYSAFIDSEGNKQPFLSHFLDQKNETERFTVDDLTNVLYTIGPKPSSTFEEFHNICYNSEGEPTSLLKDLYSLGLKPSNLGKILHNRGGSPVSRIKLLHNFYLNKNIIQGRQKELNVIKQRLKSFRKPT